MGELCGCVLLCVRRAFLRRTPPQPDPLPPPDLPLPNLPPPPLCQTAQNVAFFPLPPPFSLFFSLSLSGSLVSFFSLWGSFPRIWWCFEGQDTQIYPHPTPAHTHAHTTQHNTPTQHTTPRTQRTPLKKKIGLSRTWLKRTWPKQNLA